MGRRDESRARRVRVLLRRVALTAGCVCIGWSLGCPPVQPPDNGNDNAGDNANDNDGSGRPAAAVWSRPFDDSKSGALSSVWGSGPDDVFIVGGTPSQAEIYHFDGSAWTKMNAPAVGLLVWVYGFGPDDVYAVGVNGAAAHWDGTTWRALNPGTTADLWGIWGPAPDDMWIVGGEPGIGPPVLIHFDGRTFTRVAVPDNDRNATALFKVWGIGSRVFAVGERGLILSYENGRWRQVPAGAAADEDFVSLWGVSDREIVAVGGRSSARIAVYDGRSWQTQRPTGVPGLNGVFMVSSSLSIVGGQNGFVGAFNPLTGELVQEESPGTLDVHAIWGDGAGRVYGVGGRFSTPYVGQALVRTPGGAAIRPVEPRRGTNPVDNAALEDVGPRVDCNANNREDPDDIAAGVSEDCDGNGVPDECQGDSDGDGAIDACDECPDDALNDPHGCGCGQRDSDGDGVCDADDACPGSDDRLDADGDGVPNACDRCPGSDDKRDADGDGVPDGCDICPAGDDAVDADRDGVPNSCDRCAGFNDNLDSDADGVPSGCDVCPGFDDSLDTDGDGVPNGCDTCGGDDTEDGDGDGTPDACDICPGFDDAQDSDGDGRPDGCDRCTGFNDSADSDGDGVPDGCDRCPGFNDNLDADGDSVPNGCDRCPGSNDALDSDGDGVPDGCDICPGHNDALDSDGDGLPNGCDPCPTDPQNDPHGCGCNLRDSDGDGVCDPVDQCPGSDDNADCNFNGVPDGCDCFVTDCPLGQDCDGSGDCIAVSRDMSIQEAVLDPNFPDPIIVGYQPFSECGEHRVTCGLQGWADEFLRVRVTGFPVGSRVFITHELVTINADGSVNTALCPLQEFTANGNGYALIHEGGGIHRFDFARTIPYAPATFHGQRARLRLTFRHRDDSNITATVMLYVTLIQDGPACN